MSHKMTDKKKSPHLLFHSIKRFSEDKGGAETGRGDFSGGGAIRGTPRKQVQHELQLTMFRVFN